MMPALWVAVPGAWIRADRIVEIGVQPRRIAPTADNDFKPGTAFVVTARVGTTTGKWRWDEDSGSGDTELEAYSLAHSVDQDTARALARRLVRTVITYADVGGIVHVTATGVKVERVSAQRPADPSPRTPDATGEGDGLQE
ncbi:hypothetical protein [Nocardia transvalensis]|uniref:hypothetical protein n=1 Tax=Nocardia transvalensis TaxID=37333 RepID=UPI0018963843|nr:hypothetical protein [Nocardia transvalensis]MBF6333542.1 hypothetical protein [Nocardia transvalensis]